MSDDNIFVVSKQSHYQCYYCMEEIEYEFGNGWWRHTGTGLRVCQCKATPSNVPIGE